MARSRRDHGGSRDLECNRASHQSPDSLGTSNTGNKIGSLCTISELINTYCCIMFDGFRIWFVQVRSKCIFTKSEAYASRLRNFLSLVGVPGLKLLLPSALLGLFNTLPYTLWVGLRSVVVFSNSTRWTGFWWVVRSGFVYRYVAKSTTQVPRKNYT